MNKLNELLKSFSYILLIGILSLTLMLIPNLINKKSELTTDIFISQQNNNIIDYQKYIIEQNNMMIKQNNYLIQQNQEFLNRYKFMWE